MSSENLLNINLAQAASAGERIEIELSDRCFADLEQEEISGGEVHADILVKASAGSVFQIQIQVHGRVTVACDRCLDPLVLPVEAEETVKVKDADPDEGDDVEMYYLEANCPYFELSWPLYEIIETALPLQRVHPENECNPDMTSYILPSEQDEEEGA